MVLGMKTLTYSASFIDEEEESEKSYSYISNISHYQNDKFVLSKGDIYTLIGAICFAFQIILIDKKRNEQQQSDKAEISAAVGESDTISDRTKIKAKYKVEMPVCLQVFRLSSQVYRM